MKTKIKIVLQSDRGQYKHLYFHILEKRYPFDKTEALESIGFLHWQGSTNDKGEFEWYAFSGTIEGSNNPEHFRKMAQVLDFAKKNAKTWNPSDIFHAIGGEEYALVYGSLYAPVSKSGQRVYNVKSNNEVWCHIVAPSQTMAEKQAKKIKPASSSVEYVCEINLEPTKY